MASSREAAAEELLLPRFQGAVSATLHDVEDTVGDRGLSAYEKVERIYRITQDFAHVVIQTALLAEDALVDEHGGISGVKSDDDEQDGVSEKPKDEQHGVSEERDGEQHGVVSVKLDDGEQQHDVISEKLDDGEQHGVISVKLGAKRLKLQAPPVTRKTTAVKTQPAAKPRPLGLLNWLASGSAARRFTNPKPPTSPPPDHLVRARAEAASAASSAADSSFAAKRPPPPRPPPPPPPPRP